MDTLQNRYRPNKWQDIIGQAHIIDILQGIIKNKSYTFTRSYIFAGQFGGGKTTIARLFAMAINCDNNTPPCLECKSCQQFIHNQYTDYIEIDAGSFNKVDDIKRLIDIAKTYPLNANKHRIILLDEAHRLSNQAWDAMLKLLEDGVTKTIFLFATTEGEKIRKAIHSRSLTFTIRPLSSKEIFKELQRICQLEKIEYDINSLENIAFANRGRMRDALKTLDMYVRSHNHARDINLTTPEAQVCEILKLSFFNKTNLAIEELDKLIINTGNLGEIFCNALSALYCYPNIKVSLIKDETLATLKTLLDTQLKKLITSFIQYKPQTYEQIKLWLLLINEAGIKQQEQDNIKTQRPLFKQKEIKEKTDTNDTF